jgi:hypothetical protein
MTDVMLALGLLDPQELDIHPLQRWAADLYRPAVCADGDGIYPREIVAAV